MKSSQNKTRTALFVLIFQSLLWAVPIITVDSTKTTEEIIIEYANATSERGELTSTGLAHPPIETTVWGVPKTVIGFYGPAVLLFPDSGRYVPVIIDTSFEAPGKYSRIVSVFFANADKDPAKELCVLYSGVLNQHGGTDGEMFFVNVYDDIKKPYPAKLTYLQNISEKLDGGCDCTEYEVKDGEVDFDKEISSSEAKFRDAAGVKATLKKLGY